MARDLLIAKFTMPTFLRRAVVLGVLLLLPSMASATSFTFFSSESAFISATSATLLEDFESVVPKDVALSSISHNGVTYTPVTGPNVFVSSPGYTNYGAGVGTTTSSILTASGDEDFVATFSTPHYAVGFDVYLNGLGPAFATFFSGSTPILTNTYAGFDNRQYLGVLSSDPITSVEWKSTLGGRLNTGIDNISVTDTAAVPEPATLLLLGSGLAMIRRRVSKKGPGSLF